ncbi:protocatechuate 3,4-dioxygenase subunit alpha [Phenylobacterium montanum]|uniref:Protocatechuate 3,4-dioxygenase subunit alpha n=1 Tax=Phenylobacterium montanum TaxID=2823693 RepID=A0A975G382_9CAUL|nr:protocatechuate 3,4-dioxygenase subunit alpha [Caulobacter sp. S6]QUD89186.1 protocatechuate 3,4-dioxygenase subunit alpha [Caulobacter sp. S6]
MAQDNQSPELFGQTPWQTVGPFFHYGLPWKGGADLTGRSDLGARPELMPDENYVLAEPRERGAIAGQKIEIVGQVFDAAGAPVPDAMIEIWQANAAGRYDSPADDRGELALDEGFTGFGRASTGDDGGFRFRTVLPGRVPGPGNSQQAPHIAIGVFGRGLIKRLVTRLYFEGGPGNDEDPILALVPAARRATLIARPVEGEPQTWRFDIRLQGEHETVFFDC